ncbi:MAG: agmatine deiminase family protein, partial [Caulobacterales bacterium]|nr:agmatine deiminase family protein [Caulobacterales bacterium]
PGDADPQTRTRLIELAGADRLDVDLVAEGGALDSDGQGTVLACRASLLGRNRNPSLAERDVEAVLRGAVGAERVVWVERGLRGDHTDGHIDTLARFARPGLVLCQAPAGPGDPNAEVLDEVARALDRARDADGRRLDVARLPSPGFIADADGGPAPATHMNYVHAGDLLAVPDYGAPTAAAACAVLAEVFPDRRVVPLPARALLAEGGAFHCATSAAPAEGARL